MKALLLFLLASSASAQVVMTVSKPVDGGQLRDELTAAGCTVKESMVIGNRLTMDATGCDQPAVLAAHTPKDPAIIKTQIETARTQAIALAKKLKAGTITNAEKDGLLLRLCFLLLSQDQ